MSLQKPTRNLKRQKTQIEKDDLGLVFAIGAAPAFSNPMDIRSNADQQTLRQDSQLYRLDLAPTYAVDKGPKAHSYAAQHRRMWSQDSDLKGKLDSEKTIRRALKALSMRQQELDKFLNSSQLDQETVKAHFKDIAKMLTMKNYYRNQGFTVSHSVVTVEGVLLYRLECFRDNLIAKREDLESALEKARSRIEALEITELRDAKVQYPSYWEQLREEVSDITLGTGNLGFDDKQNFIPARQSDVGRLKIDSTHVELRKEALKAVYDKLASVFDEIEELDKKAFSDESLNSNQLKRYRELKDSIITLQLEYDNVARRWRHREPLMSFEYFTKKEMKSKNTSFMQQRRVNYYGANKKLSIINKGWEDNFVEPTEWEFGDIEARLWYDFWKDSSHIHTREEIFSNTYISSVDSQLLEFVNNRHLYKPAYSVSFGEFNYTVWVGPNGDFFTSSPRVANELGFDTSILPYHELEAFEQPKQMLVDIQFDYTETRAVATGKINERVVTETKIDKRLKEIQNQRKKD